MPMSKESFYLPKNPTFEEVKAYLSLFVPWEGKEPPKAIIIMIGGQSTLDEINEVVTQEIERAKIIYKKLTGEDYGL